MIRDWLFAVSVPVILFGVTAFVEWVAPGGI